MRVATEGGARMMRGAKERISRPSHPRNILREKVEKTVFVLWLKRRRRQWKEQRLECKEWANLRRRHFFIPKLYKWHLGTLNLAYLTSRQA